MANDDINILFAGCIAIVLLIADSIAVHRKERQLMGSNVQEVVEERKEGGIE